MALIPRQSPPTPCTATMKSCRNCKFWYMNFNNTFIIFFSSYRWKRFFFPLWKVGILDYGYEGGWFSFFAHFVTIFNPIYLFCFTVHSWVELKARKSCFIIILILILYIYSLILFLFFMVYYFCAIVNYILWAFNSLRSVKLSHETILYLYLQSDLLFSGRLSICSRQKLKTRFFFHLRVHSPRLELALACLMKLVAKRLQALVSRPRVLVLIFSPFCVHFLLCLLPLFFFATYT